LAWAFLTYAGDADAGERAVAPFRALAEPIVDKVKEMPYSGMYEPAEESPPIVATGRTNFVDSLDGGSAEAIVEQVQASKALMAVAHLRVLGGAMARVPDEATAFAHRRRRYMVAVAAIHERPEESADYEPWVEGLMSELDEGNGAPYVNFMGDEGEQRVRDAYPGSTWERLAAIKARYDPDNLFRLNQNVPPAAGERRVER
jgi:FAD/FMN-containing dehydrogenase